MTDSLTDPMSEAALFELLSLRCRVHSGGAMSYHNSDGQLHRMHGPARVREDGSEFWYQDGQLHRIDGPAIEYSCGSRAWFRNGQLHRLDGPAIVYSDGGKFWYINGESLTEAAWQKAVASMENV